MSLDRYKAKRDFEQSPEPKASKGKRKKPVAGLMYAIQKHAARRLHYDFRLEMEGVLKSWAVPKGIPLEKGEKRLAVHVEDHPMDYAKFEGVIPEGNYGAGSVMLWDVGSYEVLEGKPEEGLRRGRLLLKLSGKKLDGLWSLVRMKDGESWLLIKSGESMSPISVRQDDQSALSGRTMKQIAQASDRVWESDRKKEPSKLARLMEKAAPKSILSEIDKLPAHKAVYVEPMKALLKSDLPVGDRWAYEIKLDGIRAVAVRNGSSLRLFSRKPNDLTANYPEIVEALRQMPGSQWVLDGEVVALDKDGRSSFQQLQNLKRAGRARPTILYYAFDLINYEGKDVKEQTLDQRKAWLEKLVGATGGPIRFCSSLQADANTVWKRICELGLEGVVAKDRTSPYQPGLRSGAWVKVKALQEQEFVIGGFTEPQGARTHLGALLVGYYEKGKLRFAGKVGTGFTDATLQKLSQLFKPLQTEECPFDNLPTGKAGLSRAELKRVTWLKPKLVGQVKFQEWTADSILRQPVFLGLRDDLSPSAVRREKAG